MKNSIFAFAAVLMISGVSHAHDLSQANADIASCIKKTRAFLRDTPFDGIYHMGKNETGKCFIADPSINSRNDSCGGSRNRTKLGEPVHWNQQHDHFV